MSGQFHFGPDAICAAHQARTFHFWKFKTKQGRESTNPIHDIGRMGHGTFLFLNPFDKVIAVFCAHTGGLIIEDRGWSFLAFVHSYNLIFGP
jgi:hypothetical protein